MRVRRLRAAERRIGQASSVEGGGDGAESRAVVEVDTALVGNPADQTIEEAGVEIRQPVARSQTGGDGPLPAAAGPSMATIMTPPSCGVAGGGTSNRAPRPLIRFWNSGKLVAIGRASSMVTGFSDTKPKMRKLMAMR